MPRPRSLKFHPPAAVLTALSRIFGEPVDHVEVIEHSRYARLHGGMCATTRPGRILLSGSGAAFVADPALVLHEYFHVLRQWQPRRLTRTRYVLECARRGYAANRFEVEAREFVSQRLTEFESLLRAA
jgi:hypothetical protein